MNKRVLSILGIVLLFAIVGGGAYLFMQQDNKKAETAANSDTDTSQTTPPIEGDTSDPITDTTSYRSEKGVSITVTAPERVSRVVSPLTVAGTVPGSWSHEGEFTIRLLDSNSSILVEQPATLSGDWMTESPVPFSSQLTFTAEPGTMGIIVLERANPSGSADKSDSLTIPVEF